MIDKAPVKARIDSKQQQTANKSNENQGKTYTTISAEGTDTAG